MKDINLLSDGTRDLFLFVMRLAFIRKNSKNLRLLLLDEPFLAMDRKRQKDILVYLRKFAEENDFQIIFFTKEDHLKEDVLNIFKETVIHELL